MSIDRTLVQAYLANVAWALRNGDVAFSQSLLTHAIELLAPPQEVEPATSPVQIEVGVGLDTGRRRSGQVNEDAVFATTSTCQQTPTTYGLFVVADGMGGHRNGHEAAQLATKALVDFLLPRLQDGRLQGLDLGDAVVDAVRWANIVLYRQSRRVGAEHGEDLMGTTITVAATLGTDAYIANVGDSRTYLYRPETGLRAVTRDHSVVADLVVKGKITREEAYTHEKRHLVTRNLGAGPHVSVDLFREQLQDGDLLLLCSDGLWEMTRDSAIASLLASPWLSVAEMSERLLYLAHQGGGLDNIGLVLSRFQMHTIDLLTSLAHSPLSAIS